MSDSVDILHNLSDCKHNDLHYDLLNHGVVDLLHDLHYDLLPFQYPNVIYFMIYTMFYFIINVII